MASCLERLVLVTPRLRLGVGVGVVALDAFGAGPRRFQLSDREALVLWVPVCPRRLPRSAFSLVPKVEQVQDRLRFDPFVVPLQQELQPNGDLSGRLAQGAGHETLTEEGGGRDARLDQRQPNADGSPRIGPSGSSSRWAGSPMGIARADTQKSCSSDRTPCPMT
jgi:hypothetical protein